MLREFELKISLRDWISIVLLSIVISSLFCFIIYEVSGISSLQGLIAGLILGICLGLMSFSLVSLNNNFILPKIKSKAIWWVLSAFFSFFAGAFGFISALWITSGLKISVPQIVTEKTYLFSLLTGVLNYLIGLLLFFIVRMKANKERIEKMLLETRLKSLETQLNSHFIHNILNAIIALIEIDKQRAIEALIKLSHFLRRLMKEASLIPLKEELENIRDYVYLENVRFGSKIKVVYPEESEALEIKVPKFSVQLLVENAIKHGLLTDKVLNIEIKARVDGEKVEIIVINDGKRIDSFKLGTGLKNLSERLQILLDGKLTWEISDKTEFKMRFKKK
ncbi:sensor histidine kinase [Thermodesulfovibrio hydrogeniphilus]